MLLCTQVHILHENSIGSAVFCTVPILYRGPPLPPLKSAYSHGVLNPHLIHVTRGNQSPHSKRHLDRFSGFWVTVCKTVRPVLSDRCLSCPVCLSYPVCDVGVLWPNGWTDQNETWHAGRPRPRPHCVGWGPTSPKGAQPPIFGPCSLCPNGWVD